LWKCRRALKNCVVEFSPYEIRATVQNRGKKDAPAFIVEVNGIQKVVDGLPVGIFFTLNYPISSDGLAQAIVDPTNQIMESDENNNTFRFVAPTPTPPPFCTPTPTVMP